MKKILLSGLALLFLIQACRKNIDEITQTQNGPIPIENVLSSLTGRVVDENGNPVAGALVLLENGNNQITDAKGMFFYHDHLLNKNGAYIKVEKAGYFTSARFSFQHLNSASLMQVQLIPKKLAGEFNAIEGGAFSFDNGASVTIPANALVGASGAAYTGNVKAYAVWLDPTDQRTFERMPGDLRALDTFSHRKILTTYGMIGVELESAGGEPLQIAPERKAKIALKVPTSLLNSAPSTIPLWHFNEDTGYWREEGSATLSYDGEYRGEVSHFSFWNCDEPGNLVMLSGKVVETSGEGVSSAGIQLTRTDGEIGYGITEANGNFSGLVPANEAFTINISGQCGQSYYTSQIGPFSENTTLAPITINTNTIATISGTVVDCNGQPLAYSTIIVEPLSGSIQPIVGFSDSDGAYSIHFTKCNPEFTATITAYDGAQLYQSTPQTVEIIDNTTTVDPLTVCTAPDEYIQMNVDGNIHYFIQNPKYTTWIIDSWIYGGIQGINNDSSKIELGFKNISNNQATISAVSGRFLDPTIPLPIEFGCIYCASVCACANSDTQPVIFSNVPTAPGQYAIGSVTGNVLVGNVLKPYSISFRIKQ